MVTMTKSGDKIVLWHPEKKFPYELSKPMPRDKGNLEMVRLTFSCELVCDPV